MEGTFNLSDRPGAERQKWSPKAVTLELNLIGC